MSDICSLPPDNSKTTGRACMAFVPSWTFNSTSNKCESYVYGGCGKTANLFRTEEACQSTCGSTASKNQLKPLMKSNLIIHCINFFIFQETVIHASVRNQESCLLPVAKGPCFGFMKRYGFNKVINKCILIIRRHLNLTVCSFPGKEQV